MSVPRVFVIILNWNGKEDSIECLNTLQCLKYENLTTIVVDNGSRDGSPGEIRRLFPHVLVVENGRNLGFSEGNNIGIRMALQNGADYICLLNNDTAVEDPLLLHKMVGFAEENERVGIVSPVILYYQSRIIWFAGGRIDVWKGSCRHYKKGVPIERLSITEPIDVEYVTGCCLLAKREVFEKIGLLEPVYFLYYEDADWCARARKAGYRCFVLPSASIYHKKSSSTAAAGRNRISPTQAYFLARNSIIFAWRNLCGYRRYVFIASQFTTRFFYNVMMLSNVKAVGYLLRGLLHGISWSLRSRR